LTTSDILLEPGFFATYAVIQAIVLVLLVRLLEPFSPPPLVVVFLLAIWGGTGAALLALLGNAAVVALLPPDARTVFGDAVAPPLVEEAAKGLALLVAILISRRFLRDAAGWRFEGVTAGLICGAAVGVGFGFTEDFFYFVNHAGTEGVRVGADVYLGRRDFFGPTALHHPLFTGAFGAGLGAAAASSRWRPRLLWPLVGLAVAALMHAVNNGLVQLILDLRFGLGDATAWAKGRPVPAGVSSTASHANTVLRILDFTYIALFLGAAFLWQRHERSRVRAALSADAQSGLLSTEDVETVCRPGARTRLYARLLARGERDRTSRLRAYHREVARLGLARWRAQAPGADPTALRQLRRRVIAAQGMVRDPGAVRLPELAIVGRADELAALTEILTGDSARQVTVVGPGGSGKTRLALELASRLGPHFADGTFFVDLSSIEDAAAVPAAIAASLEIELPRGEDPVEWLGSLLRDREALLVLDNFEQVADAAEVVPRLTGTAARLRILITSRTALRNAGETEFELGPLPLGGSDDGLSPAATLFVDRARRAGGTVDLPADSSSIEEICAQLDGLPLAIELVAARARSLPIGTLAGHLDRALDLAGAGGPGLPRRQRTLRGAIAWSEDLLDPRSRRLFADLSAFPAGARLDGLEQQAGGGPAAGGVELLDALQRLTESSLAKMEPDPDGVPRYRMLATVRAYARERSRHGPGGESVSLTAYARSLASSSAPGAWGGETFAVFARERANVLDAIRTWEAEGPAADGVETILNLAPLWERGPIDDVRSGLATLLSQLERDGLSPDPRAQRLLGRMALLQGDYERAGELLEAILEQGPAPEVEYLCLWDLSWIAMFRGELESAESALDRLLGDLPAGGASDQEARCLVALGRVRAELGRVRAGRELAERGRRLREELGDESGAISASSTLARIQLLDDAPARALAEAEAALGRAQRAEDDLRQAEAMFPLCSALEELDRVPDAARHGQERLARCLTLGDRLGVAEILDLCALLWTRAGSRDEAGTATRCADLVRKSAEARRWPRDERLRAERVGGPLERSPAERQPSLGEAASIASAMLDRLLERDAARAGA